MGHSKRTIRRQARDERRAERFAGYGRQQELSVKQILEDSKLFDKVILHPPHSASDGQGQDFTVLRGEQFVSFGVTISLKSWNRSKVIYPDIPQFCFPLNAKPETVIRRVAELFTEAQG